MVDPSSDDIYDVFSTIMLNSLYSVFLSTDKRSEAYDLELSFTSEENYLYISDLVKSIAFRLYGSTLGIEADDPRMQVFTAFKRVLPIDDNSPLEISVSGHSPGNHWDFYGSDGKGNYVALSDDYGATDYTISISIAMTRPEGEWLDRIIAIAQEANNHADAARGKLEYVNNYIVNHFNYNYPNYIYGYRVYSHNNSVKEMIENGNGICSSYSHLVSYVCFYLGIPCIELTTQWLNGCNPDGHMWNCVYVDGSWKMLDITWNDTTGYTQGYFLVDSIPDAVHDPSRYDDDFDFIEFSKSTAINVQEQISILKDTESLENSNEYHKSTITITIQGNAIEWVDAVPFIDSNSRTIVPLRAVGDALGITVDWNDATREAIFSDGTTSIRFPIDSNTAYTGEGRTIQMDTMAILVDGRTYAPVKYLAEFFNYNVDWDGESNTVAIWSNNI